MEDVAGPAWPGLSLLLAIQNQSNYHQEEHDYDYTGLKDKNACQLSKMLGGDLECRLGGLFENVLHHTHKT